MWLWQHKNIHKRHLLWAKLFGICLFFHLLFLLWIFCGYRDNSYTIAISLNKKLDYSAPILFMPRGIPATHTSPTAIKTTTTKSVPIKITPKPVQSSFAPLSHKASADLRKAPEKAPTVMAIPSFAKASADKPKKPELPKPAPIPVVKKDESKIESPKQTTQSELPKKVPPTLATKVDSPNILQKAAVVLPENALISNNYREVEALRRHAQLQKEIIQCWKPPIGVSPTCACDISFSVSTTGAVQFVTMTKSSGALMYDISARQALYAMTMPKWTYGKQLIINFSPSSA